MGDLRTLYKSAVGSYNKLSAYLKWGLDKYTIPAKFDWNSQDPYLLVSKSALSEIPTPVVEVRDETSDDLVGYRRVTEYEFIPERVGPIGGLVSIPGSSSKYHRSTQRTPSWTVIKRDVHAVDRPIIQSDTSNPTQAWQAFQGLTTKGYRAVAFDYIVDPDDYERLHSFGLMYRIPEVSYISAEDAARVNYYYFVVLMK